MATRVIDPDLEDEADGNVETSITGTEVDDEEDDLDLTEDDEEEDEEDDASTKTTKTAKPTVAGLQKQLDAAKAREAKAIAAAVRERKTRKAGGVNRNGKPVTPGGAEKKDDPEDRSTWPEAARKAVEKAEKDSADRQADIDAANAREVDSAIQNGLVAAGLKIPTGADAEARRKLFKRVTRIMDTESIEKDGDGDIVGVEDEIEQVKLILPDLFGDPPASPSTTTLVPADDKPKPKVNLNGGSGAGTGRPANRAPGSSADVLLSKEYANRNKGKQAQ
jgi:hypothetical protein